MKGLFAAVAVSTLVAALCVSAQVSSQTTEKDTQAADDVRRLNAEEVEAFLHRDPKAMGRLWSDDLVVTNPLNRFVTKQQVLVGTVLFHS